MTDKDHYDYDDKSHLVTTKDKEFLDVGKYDVTLTYDQDDIVVNFEVKDTTAPRFDRFKNEIIIEKDADMNVDDFKKFFEIFDFSDFELFIETSNVDFHRVGTYPMQVTAIDKYGNETTKIVNVVVISTEEAEETGNLTAFADGRIPVSAETRERMEAGETNIEETINVEPEEQPQEEQNVQPEPVPVPTPTPAPAPQPEPTPEPEPQEDVITYETVFDVVRNEGLEATLLSSINALREEMGYNTVTANDQYSSVATSNAEASANQQAAVFDQSTLPANTDTNTYNGQSYVANSQEELTATTSEVAKEVAAQENATSVSVGVYESTKTTNKLVNGQVTESTQETTYYASVVTESAVQTSNTDGPTSVDSGSDSPVDTGNNG